MLITDNRRTETAEETAERMKKLKERADRFSTQRAFETVRERVAAKQKPKSPK